MTTLKYRLLLAAWHTTQAPAYLAEGLRVLWAGARRAFPTPTINVEEG